MHLLGRNWVLTPYDLQQIENAHQPSLFIL